MKTKERKEEKPPEDKKKIEEISLIRIMEFDIPGNKDVYTGLTKIKGVSWSLSNAICNILKIDKKRKIGSLKKEEVLRIINLIKVPEIIPNFMLNRRRDLESGKDTHLVASSLELQKEFDIKRLKKVRSYRGLRHALGQPVRGQRTRSHFRKNKSVGVAKKSKKGKKG